MRVKVKICGIRSVEAAQVSIRAGADFLGFNFVTNSRRYTDPQKAKMIIDKLPKNIKLVGVFQNEKIEKIKKLIFLLGLDFVQLHGEEGSGYFSLKKYARIIKAFSLGRIYKFEADYFLIDREKQGEGQSPVFRRIKYLQIEKPYFIAGGLTSETVGKTVKLVNPYGVDVAGGVETNGSQDIDKIKAFIREAKKYDI